MADMEPLRTTSDSRLDYITALANSDFASKWTDVKAALLTVLMELDAQRRNGKVLRSVGLEINDRVEHCLMSLDAFTSGVGAGDKLPKRVDDLIARVKRCELAAQREPDGGTWQDVLAERQRQTDLWGGPDHDDTHFPTDWFHFIAAQTRKFHEDTLQEPGGGSCPRAAREDRRVGIGRDRVD